MTAWLQKEFISGRQRYFLFLNKRRLFLLTETRKNSKAGY
jgi:hypothetical protein